MDLGYKLKQENPWNKANIFSKLFFGWMVKLVGQGSRNEIELKTLYKAPEKHKSEILGDRLGRNWNNEINRARKQNRKPSFFKAIAKTFFVEFMLYGLLWFLGYGVINCLEPRVLRRLISAFSATRFDDNSIEMYACSAVLIIFLFINVLLLNHCNFGLGQLGMRIRIAASSLVYRKITRLNQKSLGETGAGQVVNLLSNDVNRFDFAVAQLHALWVTPIQAVVLGYFMWEQVGISFVAGLSSLAIISLPLQAYLAKVIGNLRLKISKKTDSRVKLMSEILAGIQVIKMYAWEKPFEKIVEFTRRSEIKDISNTSYIKGVYASCIVFNDRLSLCLTVICFVLLGNHISADKVFSLAQAFNILQLSMAYMFPQALSTGAEALISIKRLQNFLLLEEKETANAIESIDKKGVILNGVNASWVEGGSTLQNLSLEIPPGTLCAIVGPVGAGKSSILQLLLGELLSKSGRIQIGGEISYSSQEPWLFQSTVRNNITFGRPFDKSRYEKVVKVCALERDFDQFPQRDFTIVGERGVSLSGGQRARINLARAIYNQADIYLLDDPLSAVDSHVGKHLFEECIYKHLKGKVRILVTHQLQYLKKANLIVVINDGKVEAQGTFEELTSMKLDFTKMLENSEESSEKSDGNDNEGKPNMKDNRNSSSISIRSSISGVGSDGVPDEEESGENPNSKPLKGYILATKQIFLVVLTVILMILGQGFCAGTDFWVAIWTGQEETRFLSKINDSTNMDIDYSVRNISTDIEKTRVSNFSIHDIFEDIELDGVVKRIIKTEYGMGIYGLIIALAGIVTITRSMMFFKMCMLASINLHFKIFHGLLKAPMRFFDTNPSGRILNRFSKDMGAVDEYLPRVLLDSLQVFLVMVGILVNIGISNPYLIIGVVILGLAFLKMKSLYTSTARSVKHIEGTAKSPMFSHVNATLNGLTTIRASNAEDILIDEFDEHQNVHSAAWFLTVSTSTTFGLWLDLICIVFICVITSAFIIIFKVSDISGSLIGLALSQSLVLIGMMQYGMKQLAEVVNQLISVDRVLQYTSLETEGPFETPKKNIPQMQWPGKGLVEFKNLTLKYIATDPPVLKGLDFRILPGEKIGIVGRTGAGKSSLIAALFRLAPLEGSILIDEIDTKDIGLADLRKKISIIPQEPVLFSATLRYNLDPFEEYEDDRLWKALDQVNLKESVDSLDFLVSEGGANFSVGQRQLVCLARAILKNNKILVLDEATANVDHQTDSFIQQTIRQRFKDCTVLTIAHRLNTIMDSDKVLVMNFGSLVEFDHPHKLLQMPDGYLTKMVLETGPTMTEQLKEVAAEAFAKNEIENRD